MTRSSLLAVSAVALAACSTKSPEPAAFHPPAPLAVAAEPQPPFATARAEEAPAAPVEPPATAQEVAEFERPVRK